jgi:hypothetical protein
MNGKLCVQYFLQKMVDIKMRQLERVPGGRG